MKKVSALLIFACSFCITDVHSSGIFGQAVKDFGNLVGSEDIKDAGEALDNAHRDFKNDHKLYKDIEEGGSKMVRDAFLPLCTAPFQAITNWTMARCANWQGRMQDRSLIHSAKKLLVDSGVFKKTDFNGVEIRWCPLSGAHGMAPDRGKVLLDTRFLSRTIEEISILLGHEMKHIQQYRRMGSDNFKCSYSQQYVECGSCQNDGHKLEREAYDFEDYVYDKINDYLGEEPRITSAGFQSITSGAPPLITYNCLIQGTRLQIDEFDNVYPHGRRALPQNQMCAFDIWPQNSHSAFCVSRSNGYVLTRNMRGMWVQVGSCQRAW